MRTQMSLKKNQRENQFIYSQQSRKRLIHGIKYEKDAYIVFGPETRGLPEDYILENFENAVRIPMRENIRSLNLSNSVAIVAYEIERQWNFENLQECSSYFKKQFSV